MVLFVEQMEIENLVLMKLYTVIPLMVTTLYSGWNVMFGTGQNLLKYFLKFLPTISAFKISVMNT